MPKHKKETWLTITNEDNFGPHRFMFSRDGDGLIADIRIEPDDLLEVFMHSGLDFNGKDSRATGDQLNVAQQIIDKIDEQIEWQKEERNPFAVVVITVLNRVKRKAENLRDQTNK